MPSEALKICSVRNCDRPMRYRVRGGLCTKHWARHRRGMELDYQPPTECQTCGAPIKQHPNRKGRFRRFCDGCAPSQKRENRKRFYYEHRERAIQRAKEWKIRSKFGLSMDEYEAILARGCAICGAHPTGPRAIGVDHDHSNGNVRDALCWRCNVGLGSFEDDPDRLRAAAEYIEAHREPDRAVAEAQARLR